MTEGHDRAPPLLCVSAGGRALKVFNGYMFVVIAVFVLALSIGPRRSDPSAWVITAAAIAGLGVLILSVSSLRVIVTDKEVRCTGFMLLPRTMQRGQIASVTRTLGRLSYRGAHSHYITLTPNDVSLKPLRIKTDFIKPADVLALWRILRSSQGGARQVPGAGQMRSRDGDSR